MLSTEQKDFIKERLEDYEEEFRSIKDNTSKLNGILIKQGVILEGLNEQFTKVLSLIESNSSRIKILETDLIERTTKSKIVRSIFSYWPLFVIISILVWSVFDPIKAIALLNHFKSIR